MQKMKSYIQGACIGALLTFVILIGLSISQPEAFAAVRDSLTPIFRTVTVTPSAGASATAFAVYGKDGTNIFSISSTQAVPKITMLGTTYTGATTNHPLWKTNTTLKIINGMVWAIE